MKYLVSQGADVNQSDNEGRIPVLVAYYKGHLSIVKYLLSHGADINQVNIQSDNEWTTKSCILTREI